MMGLHPLTEYWFRESSTLYDLLINVAPAPFLIRLERLDDRVARGVKMLGGMAIGRTIAAANMTTDQTDAQVHPYVATLEALFTALCARRYRADFIHVLTTHDSFLSIGKGASPWHHALT